MNSLHTYIILLLSLIFHTILGEIFVHNLLTKVYDWVNNNLYNLSSSAQISYRRFILHHSFQLFSEDMKKAKRAYREYMGGEGELRREEVYATVDQRILGGEGYVQEVMARVGSRDIRGRRRHGYRLSEIGKAVEGVRGVGLGELREKRREESLRKGRRVMSLVAKEYGYKGQEIAEHLRRDPSVITRFTRYLREGDKYRREVERVHVKLQDKSNKQV